jgi:integrase
MNKVFTDRFLKSLEPAEEGKRAVYWDAAKQSFGCRVTDKGVVSFFVMRRMQGKKQPVRVVLGRYPKVTLAKARKLAERALGDLSEGVHPKEREQAERRAKEQSELAEAKKKANTFAALAEEYTKRRVPKMRTGKAVSQVIERELTSRWGSRPVFEIRRADVIKMVDDVGRSSGVYAAHKALALAKSVFNLGIVLEFGGLDRSPCHLVKVSELVGKQEPRQRVLTDDELRLIWLATEGPMYPVGPFVRLLLLTGARRNEVARMTWDEVKLEHALWTIPAARVKTNSPHEVPLSPMACDLLASLPRFPGPHVFSFDSGKRAIRGFGKFKDEITSRTIEISPPGIEGWRFHDLRRTVRTRLSELGVSPFIAELVLGHQQKGVHAVYDVHRYQREKRDALEQWAARLREIVEPPPLNVVKLRTPAPRCV